MIKLQINLFWESKHKPEEYSIIFQSKTPKDVIKKLKQELAFLESELERGTFDE